MKYFYFREQQYKSQSHAHPTLNFVCRLIFSLSFCLSARLSRLLMFPSSERQDSLLFSILLTSPERCLHNRYLRRRKAINIVKAFEKRNSQNIDRYLHLIEHHQCSSFFLIDSFNSINYFKNYPFTFAGRFARLVNISLRETGNMIIVKLAFSIQINKCGKYYGFVG